MIRRGWCWWLVPPQRTSSLGEVQGTPLDVSQVLRNLWDAPRVLASQGSPPLFPIAFLVILSLKQFGNSNHIIFIRKS